MTNSHRSGTVSLNSRGHPYSKFAEKIKAEEEKPEPILDADGQTRVQSFNSDTHIKIILSRETARQLADCARGDRYSVQLEHSWDEIIQALLGRHLKRKKKVFI